MTALPVDFRACRGGRCGNGPDSGAVWASDTGQPATAFVHVVDCRGAGARGRRGARHDCSGRARRQPLHPVLALLRGLDQPPRPARKGRLARGRLGGLPGPDRAGRNRGPGHLPSRLQLRRRRREAGSRTPGLVHRSAWGPSTGRLYVSGGSHAGHVHEDRQPLREPAGPRPIASPWSRSRPSTPPPAAPASRSSLPGASPSTAIRRTRAPDSVLPSTFAATSQSSAFPAAPGHRTGCGPPRLRRLEPRLHVDPMTRRLSLSPKTARSADPAPARARRPPVSKSMENWSPAPRRPGPLCEG